MVKLDDKIKDWKKRLLDLGKLNRLINCTLPKSGGNRVSRTALLIKKPDYEKLWKKLVDSNDKLAFPIEEQSQLSLSDKEELTTESTFSNGILTNQSPYETCKTLRVLMKKTKEFTEETGLNALYIAFGFLEWKENGTSEKDMRSPLILVPVVIKQESINAPIYLSRSDDEITINRALEQKLLNDFGISLPEFDEDNWEHYFPKVCKAYSGMPWQVQANVAQLSLFSFLKINMYHDLEKHADEISRHQIIRALNGEAFDNGIIVSEISRKNHDDTEPQEVFSIADADSSQQDAILLAKSGVSFVLQGPPGTGKSQTITNIIAELIADGKKVLFVSEKMAALDVVYKRLKQGGISDFCLTLHSHSENRKEILNQLVRALDLSRNKEQLLQEAFSQLYQLKDVRNLLNAYVKELHTVVTPLGETIFKANSIVASYGEYKNIDYIQQGAETFTPEDLAQRLNALRELSSIVAESGYQKNNPWRNCVRTNVTHEFRQRFSSDAENLLTLIDEARSLFTQIIELTGASKIPSSFTMATKISSLSAAVLQAPNMPQSWLKCNLYEQMPLVEECAASSKEISGIEPFINKLGQNTPLLISAIDNVFAYTTNPNGNYEDVISMYDTIIGEYVKLFRADNDVATIGAKFRDDFVSFQKLWLGYTKAYRNNDQIKKDISELSHRLEAEKETLRQKEGRWRDRSNSLLAEFDEKVLTIDTESMLSRYRASYRSIFSRIFSPSYRMNRKTLLAYCKFDIKLTYSETLAYLEKIVSAKTAKTEYIYQATRKNNAEERLELKNRELSENDANIQNIIGAIQAIQLQFANRRQELELTINNYLNYYAQQLSSKQSYFAEISQTLGDALNISVDSQTDFNELKHNLELAFALRREADPYEIGDNFARQICARDAAILEQFVELADALTKRADNMRRPLMNFSECFDSDSGTKFAVMPLDDLINIVRSCRDLASLDRLNEYRNLEQKLDALGIGLYLQQAKELDLPAREIVPVFEKCFYRSWLDAVVPKYPAIYEFRRERQEERISKFKNLDKSHMEISKAALKGRLMSRLTDLDALSAYSGEIALLRRESAKQRKLMPIRRLIASIPNLLPVIKPCMMMSPLSVSTYLGNCDYEFDTVVFDEASQVRTEDAICSIFRAKQTIIAGDSKQLPPTDFFSSSISDSDEFDEDDEGEISDTGAYGSLLDEAVILHTQTLLWHYRSKHENLIAFSNAKFYNDKLITFPSSVEKADDMGVEYIHVPGGVYDRGGKNGNKAEAERVAELVFEHFWKTPNRSLGVIAFGGAQQTAIEDAIDQKRKQNPQYELFFKDDKEESVFIKNLETVQGDERDTIIFSIGYAPDATGKFIMNFGPLNRVGGERRLNVAITRARYNLKLVGSILPTDIKVDQVSGIGPKLLRQYIDFAINGARAILGEVTLNGDGWFDSPFEESVYNFLTANGYDVATQVGCSGYRIDMAVRHRIYDGRFAIGIECDGRAYHSSRTARERDRLRQTVLEDMGWKIYRIWSTDWIKAPHTEGERLLKAVETAMNSYREAPEVFL